MEERVGRNGVRIERGGGMVVRVRGSGGCFFFVFMVFIFCGK